MYSQLRTGRPKDQALQAAQTALIRSPKYSHPYYWASFQLAGDWK
ncbi:CHAT domain-containing protein [Klebsiella pneumoniae]